MIFLYKDVKLAVVFFNKALIKKVKKICDHLKIF